MVYVLMRRQLRRWSLNTRMRFRHSSSSLGGNAFRPLPVAGFRSIDVGNVDRRLALFDHAAGLAGFMRVGLGVAS